jgi:ribosomal protein S10
MDLANYYKTMWELKVKHNVSHQEQYDMIPYERQIFIDLTEEHLKQLEQNAN